MHSSVVNKSSQFMQQFMQIICFQKYLMVILFYVLFKISELVSI